jgi:hypothetical protein
VSALPADVVAAEQRDVLEHQVVGDQGHLAGNHHGRQEDQEDGVAPGEATLGEHVGRQAVEEQLQHGDRRGDERAVGEPAPRLVGAP